MDALCWRICQSGRIQDGLELPPLQGSGLATQGDSEAQQALIRLIRDDDENIRLAVYRALGQCTARPVRGLFQVIERGLGDVSPPVRTASCLALGGFGNPDAAELYLGLSRHWGEVFHLGHGIVVGLAQCGNHEALMEGALDNEFAVRMVCCLALERLGRNEMAYFNGYRGCSSRGRSGSRPLCEGELNHLGVLAGMLKQEALRLAIRGSEMSFTVAAGD